MINKMYIGTWTWPTDSIQLTMTEMIGLRAQMYAEPQKDTAEQE